MFFTKFLSKSAFQFKTVSFSSALGFWVVLNFLDPVFAQSQSTPSPTAIPSPTIAPSASPTPAATPSPSPTPAASSSPTVQPTPSASPSPVAKPSPSPTPGPKATSAPTVKPSPSVPPKSTGQKQVPKKDPIAAKISALKQTQQRWIQISLTRQRLIAWEGNKPVYAVIISTGKPGTETPSGIYTIQTKLRQARMQGDDYDIPDVPYTMYYDGSYAIHGAYWHRSFGTPVSHGCVNVAVDHAGWLFNWANVGTPVIVQ
uniref:ErfK/YbiS/YcfS/YnhG family protein n=1 Tax=Cyanothece sp. (strain PCC 7425 / ATCC 29141) TaxID=395961 RepID=B8HTC5_CYAP4